MIGKSHPSEEELHAFLDGELDEARSREIAALVEADPLLGERVAAFRADKAMLKQAYGSLDRLPLPEEWFDELRPKRRAVSWRLVGSIAAAILVVLGGFSVYRGLHGSRGDAVTVALEARNDRVQPQLVVSANGAPRDLEAVVQKTVGARVKVPDLGKMGYRLQAVRVFAQAAELDYRHRDGGEFTLYLTKSDGHVRYDQFDRDGLRVCIWKDEVITAVMAGHMSTAAMQRLASLAYTGLTL
jgi:Predicted transmembrane transcriptional regulator (anti-sigma factor)